MFWRDGCSREEQTEGFIWPGRAMPRQSISPQICQFPPFAAYQAASPLDFKGDDACVENTALMWCTRLCNETQI